MLCEIHKVSKAFQTDGSNVACVAGVFFSV